MTKLKKIFVFMAIAILQCASVPTSYCKCGQAELSNGEFPCDVNTKTGGGPPSFTNGTKYPWLVSVALMKRRRDGFGTNHQFCGGVLISSKLVLTSALCLLKSEPEPDATQVWFNTHNLLDAVIDEGHGNEVKINVGRTTVHPRHVGFSDDDIAILELVSPVNFSPVCLPSDDTYDGKPNGVISGWGFQKSNELKHTCLPISVPEQCLHSLDEEIHVEVNQKMICAGHVKNGNWKNCIGDAGVPLVVQGNSGQGYTLVGISVWGVGCPASGLPGVFTRISKYMPWIRETGAVTGNQIC